MRRRRNACAAASKNRVGGVRCSTATCRSCTFAGAFNFATNLYYVQVTLSRQTSGSAPHLYTLRIR